MANLNYPDYNQGFGGYGSQPQPYSNYQPKQSNSFLDIAKTALPFASPVTSIAGIGLEAYGAYKQNEQLEKQYELQKEAFAAEQERIQRKEEEDARQRQLQNALTYGGYAQGAEDQVLDTYGSYASRVGL